jgi:hypothetical protein
MQRPSPTWLAVSLVAAALLCVRESAGQSSGAIHRNEHGVIAEYRVTLVQRLSAADGARVDALDTRDTQRGSGRALSFLAADRAVRVFLPLALDALSRAPEAARLRRLAPLLDARSTRGAIAELATMPESPLQTLPPMYNGPVDLGFYPVTAARAAAQLALSGYDPWRAPASPAVNVALSTHAALRAGADRAAVLAAAESLVRDMVFVARARRVDGHHQPPRSHHGTPQRSLPT